MSDWAEPTTMSMLGPVTCSAFTVMDPAFPPDELVCWLMMTLMPPGSEIERFGFETSIDWPATVSPRSWAFPLALAVLPLHVALELDFTTVAATNPPSRFTSWSVDCDWLLLPLPEVELLSVFAEAMPATFTLATESLRLPPLDGSGPVSASASETPNALAFKATASPLNVVVPCAKLKAGLRAKIAARQVAVINFFNFFLSFIVRSPWSWDNRRFMHATYAGARGGSTSDWGHLRGIRLQHTRP